MGGAAEESEVVVMPALACYVAVPVASFRSPRAREYLETLPVPPPATVYGMLCSAIGEPDRLVQQGAELAVALLSEPALSRVLRSLWHVKDAKEALGVEENKRPDFQELLTGLRLAVCVRPGERERRPSLADRLAQALQNPGAVPRFGGLSLGESTHLVDELRLLRPDDLAGVEPRWLVLDPDGPLALPLWVDHVGSAGTRYGQFRLRPGEAAVVEPPQEAWVPVAPPETG
jgi:CRISPR-associated protein Cas5t